MNQGKITFLNILTDIERGAGIQGPLHAKQCAETLTNQVRLGALLDAELV